MLLPWWSVQDHVGLEWVAELAFVLALALAALFMLVPRRYALALPLVVLAYYAAVFHPIWAGEHGVKQAVRGRGLPGHPRRSARLDRRRAPRRCTGRRALDGTRRPVHGQPERVLQPHGRPGVLPPPAHAGRSGRDAGAHRPSRRAGAPPGRRPALGRVPPHRRVGHPGRRSRRPGRSPGNDALAGRRRCRLDDLGQRSLSERLLVGGDRDLEAASLPRR